MSKGQPDKHNKPVNRINKNFFNIMAFIIKYGNVC